MKLEEEYCWAITHCAYDQVSMCWIPDFSWTTLCLYDCVRACLCMCKYIHTHTDIHIYMTICVLRSLPVAMLSKS